MEIFCAIIRCIRKNSVYTHAQKTHSDPSLDFWNGKKVRKVF